MKLMNRLYGQKRLDNAVKAKDLVKVVYLLDDGVSVNFCSSRLDPVLNSAALHQHYELVKLLLSRGANANATGRHSGTALHHLAFGGESPTSEGPANTCRIAEVLVSHGANPNSTDYSGDTPLHYASTYGALSLARTLLKLGANPQLKNEERKTALDLARKEGHDDIVSLLSGSSGTVVAQSGLDDKEEEYE